MTNELRAPGFLPLLLCVCAVFSTGIPAAMGAEPAFKTESGSRPGDWARYERTTEPLGRVERLSVLMETLANDGRKVTSRVTVTNQDTGETQSAEGDSGTTGTIEGTLFSDVPLAAGGKFRKAAPYRETVVVAGHAFDCVVLSATSSGAGVVTEAKVWYSPEVPSLGMVKKETVSKAMRGRKTLLSIAYRTELSDWGDASRPTAR